MISTLQAFNYIGIVFDNVVFNVVKVILLGIIGYYWVRFLIRLPVVIYCALHYLRFAILKLGWFRIGAFQAIMIGFLILDFIG